MNNKADADGTANNATIKVEENQAKAEEHTQEEEEKD